MSDEYPSSIRLQPADVRESARRFEVGDCAAGPRDRETSPDFSEGRAHTMYDRIAEHIEEVRTSLRIDVTESVYARCMEELRSLRDGRFERVTQPLENLCALVDQLQSRLALVEDARIDSLAVYVAGRPASANAGVLPLLLARSTCQPATLPICRSDESVRAHGGRTQLNAPLCP